MQGLLAVLTAGAVVTGGHVEFVLVLVQHNLVVDQTNNTGTFFDVEHARGRSTADKAKQNVVAVLVRCDDRCDECSWAGIFIDVRREDVLGELGRFVILVFPEVGGR